MNLKKIVAALTIATIVSPVFGQSVEAKPIKDNKTVIEVKSDSIDPYSFIYGHLYNQRLSQGSTGRDVRILQRCINIFGTEKVAETGIFDSNTEMALSSIQFHHTPQGQNIERYGTTDPTTWNILRPALYSIDMGELLRLWNS